MLVRWTNVNDVLWRIGHARYFYRWLSYSADICHLKWHSYYVHYPVEYCGVLHICPLSFSEWLYHKWTLWSLIHLLTDNLRQIDPVPWNSWVFGWPVSSRCFDSLLWVRWGEVRESGYEEGCSRYRGWIAVRGYVDSLTRVPVVLVVTSFTSCNPSVGLWGLNYIVYCKIVYSCF